MMITQIIIALIGATSTSSFILTLVISILPIVVGLAILRKIVLYDLSWTIGDRVTFAAFGILGYTLWAGLLVGPSLAIILSVLPATHARNPFTCTIRPFKRRARTYFHIF